MTGWVQEQRCQVSMDGRFFSIIFAGRGGFDLTYLNCVAGFDGDR